MKILLVVSVFILNIPFALASGSSPVLQKLQQVQNALNEPNAKGCPTCQVSNPSTPYLQCIQDLCPDSANAPSVQKISNDVMKEAIAAMPNDIGPLQPKLTDWMKAVVESQRAEVAALERALKEGNHQLDPKFRNLSNALLFMNSLMGLQFDFDVATKSLKVDAAASEQKLSSLTPQDRQWVIELGKAVQEKEGLGQTMIEIAMVGNMPIAKLYHDRFPGLPLLDALKKDAEDVKGITNELKEKFFSGLDENETKSLLDNKLDQLVLSGKRLDQATLQEYYGHVLLTRFMAKLLLSADVQPLLAKRNQTDLTPVLQAMGAEKKIAAWKALLNDADALNKTVADNAKNCFANYSVSMAALPSDADIQAGKKSFLAAKKAIDKEVLSTLSEHTRKFVNGGLEEIEMLYPATKANFKEDFFADIAANTEAAKNEIAMYQKLDKASNGAHPLLDFYDLLSSDWNPQASLEAALGDCSRYSPPPLEDRAIPGLSTFWASWYSLKSESFGKAVMAHELGHIVEGKLHDKGTSKESSAKYQKVKACLVGKHLKPQTPEQYEVEDFADLVSASAFSDINLGCAILNPEDASDVVVEDAASQDTHSTGLFRALHIEEVRTGEYAPDSCVKTLKAKKQAIDFGSCLD